LDTIYVTRFRKPGEVPCPPCRKLLEIELMNIQNVEVSGHNLESFCIHCLNYKPFQTPFAQNLLVDVTVNSKEENSQDLVPIASKNSTSKKVGGASNRFTDAANYFL
jgi:hypothetical protein